MNTEPGKRANPFVIMVVIVFPFWICLWIGLILYVARIQGAPGW